MALQRHSVVRHENILKCTKKVLDLILQHLSLEDLLQLSLVSKDLNKQMGKSSVFMSKIEFSITDLSQKQHQRRQELSAVMKQSNRSYENFHIRANNIGDELGLLMDNAWKTASISILDFPSTFQYVKYLSLLTPTLSSLELSIDKIRNIKNSCKLEFSSLKTLSLIECTSAAMEPFVNDEENHNLKHLKLAGIRQAKRGMKLSRIFEIFDNLIGLVRLDICSEVAEILFSSDLSNVRFNLREFRVVAPANVKKCENIQSFIRSQGSSLSEVSLLSWNRPETLYEIWDAMNILKIWHMYNRNAKLDFKPQVLKQEKKALKFLHLDFPLCTLSTKYLEPLLEHDLQSIELRFNLYESDITEVLREAAGTVNINGALICEKSYNSEYSSDSDDTSVMDSSTESESEDDCKAIVKIEIDSD